MTPLEVATGALAARLLFNLLGPSVVVLARHVRARRCTHGGTR